MSAGECVGIVGLGLIGGSLARDLAERGARVLAYDRDGERLRSERCPALARLTLTAALEEVAAADVVVLALPVDAAPAALGALRAHVGGVRLIMDVGSTKRAIVAAAEALGLGARFVGCHPLAGDHRGGWAASRSGLFAGARTYLCPTPSTAPDALERARSLWASLGARPEVVSAEAHDQHLAWTSHLPQVAATALALALASAGVTPPELGPGGRDTTRLAGSSPTLWTGIATENAAALGEALGAFEERITAVRRALAGGDVAAVERFFAAGRAWSER